MNLAVPVIFEESTIAIREILGILMKSQELLDSWRAREFPHTHLSFMLASMYVYVSILALRLKSSAVTKLGSTEPYGGLPCRMAEAAEASVACMIGMVRRVGCGASMIGMIGGANAIGRARAQARAQ